jgi:hypothetical protein
MKAGIGPVIISIGAITSSGTGSPTSAAMRSAQAPAALTMRGARKSPASVATRQPLPSRVTVSTLTLSRIVAPRLRAAFRHGRNEPAQFVRVDQLLVMEAAQGQILDAGAAAGEIGLVLRDQHLAVAGEAAIIVDQLLDPVPQRHRGIGKRDFRDMARELAHAAGIDARGVAPGMVLLEQDDREAAQGAVQRGGAAMNPAADDDHIRAAALSAHLTTALTAASLCGRPASSASVIGFTGGRSR